MPPIVKLASRLVLGSLVALLFAAPARAVQGPPSSFIPSQFMNEDNDNTLPFGSQNMRYVGKTGSTFAFVVENSITNRPFKFALIQGRLPDRLFLNRDTGEITGTPEKAEVQKDLIFRATDNFGRTFDTPPLSITIGQPGFLVCVKGGTSSEARSLTLTVTFTVNRGRRTTRRVAIAVPARSDEATVGAAVLAALQADAVLAANFTITGGGAACGFRIEAVPNAGVRPVDPFANFGVPPRNLRGDTNFVRHTGTLKVTIAKR